MMIFSPSLFDAIAEAFPLVNLIFIILFIYMLGKPLFSMFGNKNPLKTAKKLGNHFFNDQDVEIDREVNEEKKERKDVKKQVMFFTLPFFYLLRTCS